MSYVCIQTRAQIGLDSPSVSVEVHLANGLPCFHIVGLPEMAVKESRERVRAAIIQGMAVDLLGHKITDEQFLEIIQKSADLIDPSTYQHSEAPPPVWHPWTSWINPHSQKKQSDTQIITPETNPGINKFTAYQLDPSSNHVTIKESLGGWFDRKDYYSFTLDNAAQVSFDLTDIQSDVDLVLWDDNDNIIDYGWGTGNVDINIIAQLSAGQTYYIVADSFDQKSTSYNLSIDFNGGINTAPQVPDDPENTPDSDPGGRITEAYELDPDANQVVITESLGPTDDKDFYSFTLDNTTEVNFLLTDLDGDVDLILKNSHNHTIVHAWKWGNQDLMFTELLDAGKTYYVVTDSFDSKDTDYTLSIDFNGGFNVNEDTPLLADKDTVNPAPSTPPGYAGINIAGAVDYFQENHQDYAVV